MKILLINHYAGSPQLGMEFRPYYMAREWQKSGHEVLIVGATFSHLRKKQPLISDENIDGVHYRWVKVNAYKGNGIGRIMSMFLFVSKLKLHYKRILGGFVPDVVISSSTYPLDNYPAKKIADHYGAKFIYEIHDLWPLSPMELGGYSPNHPFIRVMQRAEDFAYANVDAVVSMLPKAVDHTLERGLPREKFFYVPNGIVEEDWANPQDISEELRYEIEAIKTKFDFVVGYLGGHAVSNCLDTFIDSAKILSENRIAFVLVGSGVEKNRLVQRVRDEGVKNVFFFDPIPKPQVPSLLSLMDVLFIGWNKNPLYRFGISPNKIFDYEMAGKPIVHAVEAANDPVAEAGCGISVEPENPEAIADAIMKLASIPESEREEMGKKGHDYVLKHHTYSVLSQKFVNVFSTVD